MWRLSLHYILQIYCLKIPIVQADSKIFNLRLILYILYTPTFCFLYKVIYMILHNFHFVKIF